VSFSNIILILHLLVESAREFGSNACKNKKLVLPLLRFLIKANQN